MQSRRQLRVAALRGHAARRLPAGAGRHRPGVRVPALGRRVVGQSVTGGAFLPPSFGFVGGQYVFGDYTAGKLYIAAPNAARDDIATPVDFVTDAGGPVDIVAGPDEALYWVAINSGSRSGSSSPTTRAPRAPTPVRASLVPAFQQCAAPNRTHGPPLAFGSCNPPALRSAQLTVGTPDANGEARQVRAATSRSGVVPGDPGTPADEADVALRVSITDVRRQQRARRLHRAAAGERRASGSPTGTTPASAGSPGGDRAGRHVRLDGAVRGHTRHDDRLHLLGHDLGRRGHARSDQGGHARGLAAGQVQVFDGGPDGVASTTPNTHLRGAGRVRSVSPQRYSRRARRAARPARSEYTCIATALPSSIVQRCAISSSTGTPLPRPRPDILSTTTTWLVADADHVDRLQRELLEALVAGRQRLARTPARPRICLRVGRLRPVADHDVLGDQLPGLDGSSKPSGRSPRRPRATAPRCARSGTRCSSGSAM